MIFLFQQCVSTVIIVYIIISPLNSYLYIHWRRRERYGIMYVGKIIEGLVPNLSDPITCSFSDCRVRACVVCHSGAGRLGTLKYNSLRW